MSKSIWILIVLVVLVVGGVLGYQYWWTPKEETGKLGEEVKLPEEGISGEKSITVLSPNGGEKWKIGGTYTIKWSTTGYDSSTSVHISIGAPGSTGLASGAEGLIAETENSGAYTWTVPSRLPSETGGGLMMTLGGGNVYKFSISAGDDYDVSDNYFSIE